MQEEEASIYCTKSVIFVLAIQRIQSFVWSESELCARQTFRATQAQTKLIEEFGVEHTRVFELPTFISSAFSWYLAFDRYRIQTFFLSSPERPSRRTSNGSKFLHFRSESVAAV